MKFARFARIKDRLIDFGGRAVLFVLTALICLWMVSGARAATVQITDIREEPIQDGTHAVEFRFNAPLEKDHVAIEFQRNFIQLSLRGVTAYPARTKSLDHSQLDKVFTYQYQPDLARARVLLKGPASEIQNRTEWTVSGDTLRIVIGVGRTEVAAAAAAKPFPVKAKIADALKSKAAAPNAKLDAEDDRLVQEILAKTGKPAETAKPQPANPEDQPIFAKQSSNGAAAAREKSSPAAKVFGSLLMVVGLIGAAALAYRRFALGKGIQKPGRVIEILANQSLGPKRSIALVKVLDQHMVVGMAGEGMTLLANLGASVDIEKYLDELNPSQSFSATFRGTLESSDSAPVQKSQADTGIRASIKKRIEGFKPL